jgi:predicted MarR family transcription regulator
VSEIDYGIEDAYSVFFKWYSKSDLADLLNSSLSTSA